MLINSQQTMYFSIRVFKWQFLKSYELPLIIMAIIGFCYINTAKASLIVDTGEGSSVSGGTDLYSDQWLAGQFSISDSYTISSMEGWFGTRAGTTGTVTAALYSDSGFLSGNENELFSQQFLLDAPSSMPKNNTWDGVYDVNWSLGPGTYWLAFEVRSGDTANAFMPSGTSGAPNPLSNYAFYYQGMPSWSALSSDYAFGIRIDASPVSPIPIPAAFWLFGSGLLGLVAIARRRTF
jgi:hypothetical protein